MTLTAGVNTDFTRSIDLYKRVYADQLEILAPDSDMMAKDIKFVNAAQRLGRDYFQPVCLTREMGITFNGGDGTAFNINQPLSALEIGAVISGTEIIVRTLFSYAFLTRAENSLDGTKAGLRSFISGTKYKFEGLMGGASYAREISLLYGGGPNASSVLANVVATTGSSGTTLFTTISAAQWAPMMWVGCEGGHWDIYQHGTSTKRNTAGTGEDAAFKLVSVDVPNRKLKWTSNSTNVSAVAAGDDIFLFNQRGADCLGLVTACQQTPGTLWNIDSSVYDLWRPRTQNVGGQLTFEKLMDGVTQLAEIGFQGTLNVYLSPATWADLQSDAVGMSEYVNKAGGTVEMGFNRLIYHSQVGRIVVKNNGFIQRGIALGLPEGYVMRIGSTDITSDIPGYGKLFIQTNGKAGIEAQVYSDQAPFCERPAYMCLWTGIVNRVDT